jgi:type II secretory pathway pseudopilin PulG
MRHLIASARHRAAAHDGFTMIVAMTGMLVVVLLGAAAFAAANGDIRSTGRNDNQKQAYAAAEAAIADYQYHLNQNPDYWRKCDATGDSSPVTQRVVPGTSDTLREWRALPGSNAEYTIEVLPAKTYNTCNPASPDKSMIDTSNGTFRIRATGRLSSDPTVKRSIIATFKRTGFLDFLWYTDLESQDPIVWSKVNGCAGTPTNDSGTNYPTCFATGPTPGQPDLATWGTAQCSKYYRDGRANTNYPGQFKNVTSSWYTAASSNNLVNNAWYDLDRSCTEITYGSGEYIKGPFHTNDGILVCDDPIFGRTTADRVEVSATANPDQTPIRETCGANNVQMQGTWLPGSPRLDPPPNNATLSKDATLTFKGATKIVFNGDGTMTVTNDTQVPKVQTINESPDEVIFVQAKATCSYDPYKPLVYDGTAATANAKDCGDAVVQGLYTENTTIGADNDIVITDDLTQATGKDALMGLIANNFVRVAHPSAFDPSGTALWTDALYKLMSTSAQRTLHLAPKCTNTSTATKNLKVEAAILALTHQWTVDRYGCGAGLGTLQVTGTMAQKYRGVVGIGNGSTGFIKNYTYDDRLRYRSPPKFLNPVNTAWNVAREIEQSPAT